MSWPAMSDYQEAIQSPQLCFADADLRGGTASLNLLGLPRPITGGFASVYEIASSGRRWAVRCFLKDFKDQAERYHEISGHLRTASIPYTIHCDFQPHGILVLGKRFPILKMAWVEGKPLNNFIEESRYSPGALASLAQRWQKMLSDLKSKQVAHGDLQHGNVLVAPDGALKLIDYDGMWVPALSGRGSHETGHPAYQSPNRTERDFHRDVDDFAGNVILVAILATEKRPELWDEFNNGDNLLFRKDDYLDPASSRVFGSLLSLRDSNITARVQGLIRACGFDPGRVQAVTTPGGPIAGDSWLVDHVPGKARSPGQIVGTFVFSFAPLWQRPGSLQVQRVRKEPVFVTRTRYRKEPVYETKVRYKSEPIYEQRTRIVKQTVPAANGVVGKAIRSLFGLAQMVEVERHETYQVQVGTRDVSEQYQEQTGTRDVPDGTCQEQAGLRDIIETFNEPQQGHNSTVRAVSMTRNAEWVVSGDDAGRVILWSAKDGRRMNTLQAFGGPVTGLAGVGTNLVAASGEKSVRLWNTAGLDVHTFTNQRNSNVNGVAASPDGRYVAGALGVLELYVWEVGSKRQVARLKAHKRKVLCAAFGSTHALLISGSEDMSVKVWDVKNERCQHTLYGHTAPVRCVAVAPNDQIAASGGADGYLILWDLSRGTQAMRVPAHSVTVSGVAFSPDSRAVITTGSDGRVRCWDVRSGKVISEPKPQQPSLTGMAIDQLGRRMATCGGNTVVLWENR
jgi:serine/threonine protein kinase